MRSAAVAVCLFLLLQVGRVVAWESEAGAVYVMNNGAAGNTIVVLRRAEDGTLAGAGEVPTGGLGSGPAPLPVQFGGPGPIPLESQDSLISARHGRFLIAVNAGSNDISVLEVTDDGLRLTDKAPSGGIFPVSVG